MGWPFTNLVNLNINIGLTFGGLSVRLVTSIASIALFINLNTLKIDVSLILVLVLVLDVLDNFFMSRLAGWSAVRLASTGLKGLKGKLTLGRVLGRLGSFGKSNLFNLDRFRTFKLYLRLNRGNEHS